MNRRLLAALLGVIAAGLDIGCLVLGLRTVTVHRSGPLTVSCGVAWRPEADATITQNGALAEFMDRYSHAAEVHFISTNRTWVAQCQDARSTSLVTSLILMGFA